MSRQHATVPGRRRGKDAIPGRRAMAMANPGGSESRWRGHLPWVVALGLWLAVALRALGRGPELPLAPLLLALAGLALLPVRPAALARSTAPERSRWLELVPAAVAASLYARALGHPLMSDSILIANRLRPDGPLDVLGYFLRSRVWGFHRPVSNVVAWLELRVFGHAPIGWHLVSVALHAASAVLLARLGARWLGRTGGAAAGTLFAVSALAAPTVGWAAAQPDLLATLFLLLGTLLFARGRPRASAGALVAFALAALSKEPGFVFPAFALGIVLADAHDGRGALAALAARRRELVAMLGLWAALFLYRVAVLGRLGGYRSPAGGSELGQLDWQRLLAPLAGRLWEVLLVPVNASVLPAAAITLGAVAWLGLALVLAARAGPPSMPALVFAVLAFASALLPVNQHLWIDARLETARMLYLALVGFSLAAVALLWRDGSGRRARASRAALYLLIAFQILVARANLAPFRKAGAETLALRQRLTELARELPSGSRVCLSGFPRTMHGIYTFAWEEQARVVLEPGRLAVASCVAGSEAGAAAVLRFPLVPAGAAGASGYNPR